MLKSQQKDSGLRVSFKYPSARVGGGAISRRFQLRAHFEIAGLRQNQL
jgi:hypothetical protein